MQRRNDFFSSCNAKLHNERWIVFSLFIFRSRVFYTLPGNTNSFIMFEFGLEQISLNLARRFGFSADEKTSLRGDDSDMKRQSYHSGVASHSQQRHKHQSGASSSGRTASFDKPSGGLFTLIKRTISK